MKAKNRNFGTKGHLKRPFSNESIWFYTGGDTDDEVNSGPKENARNDRKSVRQKNYPSRLSEEPPKRMRSEDAAFIVDWQMSDNF